MDYKKANDYEILYMVKENDEEYLSLLIDKYKPIMVSIVKRYLPNVKKHGLEYEDLMQECYISFLDAIRTFNEHNNVMFYTYACFCMHRRVVTVCRNYSTKKNSVLSDSDFDFNMDIIEDKEANINNILSFDILNDQVRNFLNNLGIIDSSILELKFNGFSYKEISVLLDISLKYVHSRLYVLRRDMNLDLKNCY